MKSKFQIVKGGTPKHYYIRYTNMQENDNIIAFIDDVDSIKVKFNNDKNHLMFIFYINGAKVRNLSFWSEII